MKRILTYGLMAMTGLLLVTTPVTLHSEAAPAWPADFDWEMEHDLDGSTDTRITRLPPAEVGLAIAILVGFAGFMILASRKIRVSSASKNDSQNHE